MDLKKEIAVNKKILVILVLISVLTIGVNVSYSLFQTSVKLDNVVEIHTASEMPEDLPENSLAKVVQNTLGQEGGVVGVTRDNQMTTTNNGNIREYRYSGLNVNNYVKFNNQLWRIVGVFKDGGKTTVKIVQNETLTGVPTTFTANGTSYTLSTNGSVVYWNNYSSTYTNDWATAGLKAWLNSEGAVGEGFLETIDEEYQSMIADTKYYLGSVTYDDTSYIKDNPSEAYKNERAVSGCQDNKGPSSNSTQSAVVGNETCRVWADKAATWTGKVGLLYPSDIGYSVDSQYWNTILGYGTFEGTVANSSWLQAANHSNHEWLLSPVTYTLTNDVSRWSKTGYLYNNHANYNGNRARATLSLKSMVLITKGNGSLDTPYELVYEDTGDKETKIYLSRTSGEVSPNQQTAFNVDTNTSGTFSVTSDSSEIATAIVSPSKGNQTMVTVTGHSLGNTNININFIPDDSSYNKISATFSVRVTYLATYDLIQKVSSAYEGIYGINPEKGTVCDSNCKEYRYTGEYVRNYVQLTNNNQKELWRIIGVFTDEETKEKYIRLVRNEALPADVLTSEIVVNGIDYKISFGENVYWNNKVSGTSNNDWATAGLQHYLNGYYMRLLSESTKSLLEERIHYLGSFIIATDTAVSGYQHERDVLNCIDNKGTTSSSSNFPVSGCNVWNGNDATWKGSISLMYPSDYGFSADKQYWNTSLGSGDYEHLRYTSWMYRTMPEVKSKYLWMLAPSSDGSSNVMGWNFGNYVEARYVGWIGGGGAFPVLNLGSHVKIKSGTGTDTDPYILEA